MHLPPVLTREPDGDVHFTGHRIALIHLIWYVREGQSVGQLLETFPTLNREKIEGALLYCVAHPEEVAEYVRWEEEGMAANRAARGKGMTLEELRRRWEVMHGQPCAATMSLEE